MYGLFHEGKLLATNEKSFDGWVKLPKYKPSETLELVDGKVMISEPKS